MYITMDDFGRFSSRIQTDFMKGVSDRDLEEVKNQRNISEQEETKQELSAAGAPIGFELSKEGIVDLGSNLLKKTATDLGTKVLKTAGLDKSAEFIDQVSKKGLLKAIPDQFGGKIQNLKVSLES